MANHTNLVLSPSDIESVGEAVVSALSRLKSARISELSDLTGFQIHSVRTVLYKLETLGIVYRSGRARGTRWRLG